MSFFRTAFSTYRTQEPSGIRILFGFVIVTMCSPVWVQTVRLAVTGAWVPMDGQSIAYAGIMSGLVTALLAYARSQESKDAATLQSTSSQPSPAGSALMPS